MLTAVSVYSAEPVNYNFTHDLAGDVTDVTVNMAGYSVNLASTFDYNGDRTQLAVNIGGTANFSSTDGTFDDFSSGTNDFLNTYSYDTLGDMTGISQASQTGGTDNSVTAKNVSLAYDADQRISTIDAYQGSDGGTQVYHAAYTLDAGSNLTDLTYTPGSGGGTLAAYHWDYTQNGLVNDEYSLSDTSSGASSSYTTWANASFGYDHDSELDSTSNSTNFAAAPTSNTAESFDANGNRAGDSSAVGAGNRMLYDGTYYYAYDADGNRIAKYMSTTGALDETATDITTYAWNEKNELTAVKTFATYAAYAADADSTEIDYREDAFGNLVSRTPTGLSGGSGGGSEPAEFFFYDGSNLALILNASGGVIERELDGPAVDQVFASEAGSASTTLTPGTVDWYLADNQGTVRDVVRASAHSA
jgi:hypothetical protein